MKNINYYNNSVVNGYYDIIFRRKKGIQCAWHHIKFNYIKRKISKTNIHLDIGCGPGTYLSILKKKRSHFKNIVFENRLYEIDDSKNIKNKKLNFFICI